MRTPTTAAQKASNRKLTHFHHPPLSTLIFRFAVYSLFGREALHSRCFCSSVSTRSKLEHAEDWDTESQAKTRVDFRHPFFWFCFLSRSNYIRTRELRKCRPHHYSDSSVSLRGLWQEASEPSSLPALAITVNIHPNAIIFLLALPIAFGIRKAIKPLAQLSQSRL